MENSVDLLIANVYAYFHSDVISAVGEIKHLKLALFSRILIAIKM